ncbi:hypothetical protein EDB19DRAFT_2024405 [Suillus lakei]|nr:hypothetical protein EDB19DRAFT_2024405 [Suillus lakei]
MAVKMKFFQISPVAVVAVPASSHPAPKHCLLGFLWRETLVLRVVFAGSRISSVKVYTSTNLRRCNHFHSQAICFIQVWC